MVEWMDGWKERKKHKIRLTNCSYILSILVFEINQAVNLRLGTKTLNVSLLSFFLPIQLSKCIY